MNAKTFSKIAATILLAFFAAGGACYPPTRTVTSENINAADVFTSYRIVEYNASNDGKCTRRITTQFSGGDKIYLLKPPARATYNGAGISDDSGGNFSEFGCQTDRAEFVLTDNQGAAKREVYELKKAKFDFPAAADRQSDLHISVEFDQTYNYDFSGTVRTNTSTEPVFFRFFQTKDAADLAERLNDPDAPKNLAYFMFEGKLLVIPKAILSGLPAGDAELSVSVEQSLLKPKSNDPLSSLKSQAFAYVYGFDAKLKLK